jgi:DNA repair ATPase RecN
VEEIARMLGGKTITEATVKHAEEMIERGSA